MPKLSQEEVWRAIDSNPEWKKRGVMFRMWWAAKGELPPQFPPKPRRNKNRTVKERWGDAATVKDALLGKERKCELCGIDNLTNRAYHFHHRRPWEKYANVSQLTRVARGNKNGLMSRYLMKTVAQCAVVCANCHALIHSVGYDDARILTLFANARKQGITLE